MTRTWSVLLAAGSVIAAGTYYFWSGGQLPQALTEAVGSKSEPGKAASGAGPKGNAKGSGRSGPPPAPVTVAEVAASDMPVIIGAPGTVEALATVAVRPRVDGQIVDVAFKEGDFVEQGQVLFRLDDRLVKSQILQAEANIAKDEANLKDAENILERRETLLKKSYVSEAATETARQTAEALKASIRAGQAQLEGQRTQLDYLVIRAPISGRTGSQAAKLGANIRSADILPLVTINQTKPIAVTFSVPQVELAALRGALASKAPAEITIPGAKSGRLLGNLSFVDNQVDKSTGTITAKVMVANGNEALWPGQAVEVSLTVEVKPAMLSVPAAAVLPSQSGMMVWVISAEGKASPRTVEIERIVDQTAYVAQGLKAGERVATDGQIRLAPGSSVNIQQPRGTAPPAAAGERRNNGRS